MTTPTSSAPPLPILTITTSDAYVPGVCNIGPWEIRRRRAVGIVGLLLAAVLLVALIALGAPPIARLLVLLPAWGGVFSWLQARRHFCAGFAMQGLANFGDGDTTRRSIADEAAHREDLRAVARMTRDSFVIALAIAVVAVLLPV